MTGSPLYTYVWRDDVPVSIIVHGKTETALYLEMDHLNTPIAARDQAGKVVWTWESDAFGSSVPNEDPDEDGTKVTINLKFPGQYFDKESGLHYNFKRYYDPKLGRYMSPDPIGLAGGGNLYAYVKGNPLRAIDPRGLDNPSQGPYDAPVSNGPKLPDYATFSLPTPIPGVGVTFTQDSEGSMYVGPSVGVNFPGASGRAWGVGWTGDACKPTSDALKNFLSEFSANVGVGLGATWSSPQASGSEDPSRLGLNVQTPGASVGYNWVLGRNGIRW